MTIKDLITHSKPSNMKSKFLPNCFKGKYGYYLGELDNMSNVVFGAEMVNTVASVLWLKRNHSETSLNK